MRQTLAPGASESWSPTLKARKRWTSFEEGKSSGSFESSDSIYSASCNLRIGTVKYKQGKFPMVLINSHSVPYHRIDCITVPLTFGIRQDAMLLSPVATDIRFCNLTLYNGLVGLGLNKILHHKEMMFRALRAL